MKCNSLKKWLALIGCIVLIAALALTMIGCGSKEEPQTPDAPVQESSDVQILGEGATVFQFSVVDLDETESKFEIHTDETTVGAALMKVGLIEGEEGPYGLYVKTVNGVRADYDKDGCYWAFYVGQDYAMQGIELTPIDESAAYRLVYAK